LRRFRPVEDYKFVDQRLICTSVLTILLHLPLSTSFFWRRAKRTKRGKGKKCRYAPCQFRVDRLQIR